MPILSLLFSLVLALSPAPKQCILDESLIVQRYSVPDSGQYPLYCLTAGTSVVSPVRDNGGNDVVAASFLPGGFIDESAIYVTRQSGHLVIRVGGSDKEMTLEGKSATVLNGDSGEQFIVTSDGCHVVQCTMGDSGSYSVDQCSTLALQLPSCRAGSLDFVATVGGLFIACTDGAACTLTREDGSALGGWPRDISFLGASGAGAALEPQSRVLLALATETNRNQRVLSALALTDSGFVELDRVTLTVQTEYASRLFLTAHSSGSDSVLAILVRADGGILTLRLENEASGWVFKYDSAAAFRVSGFEQNEFTRLLFPATSRVLCLMHADARGSTAQAACLDLETVPQTGCIPCASAGQARYIIGQPSQQLEESDSRPCVSCIPGYYCPDSVFALPCPASRPLSSPHSTSLADCRGCQAGELPNYVAGGCMPCPAGFYCTGTHAIACPMMRPASPPGSSGPEHCTSCSPGQYYSKRRGICRTCSQGSLCDGVFKYTCPAEAPLSPAGSSRLSNCTACPDNSRWVHSLHSCVGENHSVVAGEGLRRFMESIGADPEPPLWRVILLSVLGGLLLVALVMVICIMLFPGCFYRAFPRMQPPSAVYTTDMNKPLPPPEDHRVLVRRGSEYLLESPADPAAYPDTVATQTGLDSSTPSSSVQVAQSAARKEG